MICWPDQEETAQMTPTKTMAERQKAESEIQIRYQSLQGTMTERSRRLFAGCEALAFGYGGIAAVSRATGLSVMTVRQGLAECQAIEAGQAPSLAPQRSRQAGGGRKLLTEKYPALLSTLDKLVASTTRGDPESPLLWTARSQRNLVQALAEQGYRLSKHTLAQLLQKLGYSLQGNRKKQEGAQHPDRNAQFEHINEMVRRQLAAGEPAIAVDTKKKELVGAFKNGGRELRRQGAPECVNVHDFPSAAEGTAIPSGVYYYCVTTILVDIGMIWHTILE